MTNVSPDNTALVVVDMQNDFVHPDGALYAPASEQAVEPVNELIDMANANSIPVVFTKDVHTDEQFEDAYYYDEFEQWGRHVEEGTWGAEIVDDLNVEENAAKVVEKPTYNAFHRTELDSWLESHGVDNLVICGTLANVCVLHTASGAGLRDYRPIVVEDALGYIEEDHKDYSVEHAGWLFGEISTIDELEF